MTLTNAIITAYCACKLCCGPTAPNKTASGVWPTSGVTIAGPRTLPFGTHVLVAIPRVGTNRYVIQDRTSHRFDGRWDIYFNSHQAALNFGKQRGTVTILK